MYSFDGADYLSGGPDSGAYISRDVNNWERLDMLEDDLSFNNMSIVCYGKKTKK